MKRKLANYPNWDNVLEKGYKNRYFNNYDFKGNISLLTAIKVKQRLVIGENFVIMDNGFKWLEIYPEDNKHIAVSVCINNKNEFVKWYFDIAKDSSITKEGIPYIDDLYLDIVLTNKGEIKVLDENELQDALNNKDITQEDFDLAYSVADELIKKLDGNLEKIIKFTQKYYEILNN